MVPFAEAILIEENRFDRIFFSLAPSFFLDSLNLLSPPTFQSWALFHFFLGKAAFRLRIWRFYSIPTRTSSPIKFFSPHPRIFLLRICDGSPYVNSQITWTRVFFRISLAMISLENQLGNLFLLYDQYSLFPPIGLSTFPSLRSLVFSARVFPPIFPFLFPPFLISNARRKIIWAYARISPTALLSLPDVSPKLFFFSPSLQ